MKKILLLLSPFMGLALNAQNTSIQSLNQANDNSPVILNQTKTYTSCGYLQENNAFEDGRVSNVLYPYICADDFVVPAGECWDINQIVANFFTNNPTDASAMNIYFYDDNSGLPGTVIASYTASPSDWTTSVLGNNYGYDIHEFVVNMTAPINLCGGGSGTTYWFSIQAVNSITGSDFYWENAHTGSPYGNNGVNASSTSGPWTVELDDNFVFELNHDVTINMTVTECTGFSITVGTNTYNSTGVYQDILVSSGGCDSIVNLDLTILDTASGIDVQTSCDSLVWIDGITYYASNNTATYNYVGGAANGCDSIVMLDLTINAPTVSVTQNGVQLTADASGATYQWLDCDNGYAPVTGETNQSFTSAVNGNFAVEVIINGCTDTSACYIVDYSSVESNETQQITLFPNPSSGMVMLNGLNDLSGFTSIEVTSATGAVIEIYTTPKNEIDLSYLSEGIYYINVKHENGMNTLKLIKL